MLLKNRNARKHSLAPKRTGPYKILSISKNGNVRMENMDGQPFPGSHKQATLQLYSKKNLIRFFTPKVFCIVTRVFSNNLKRNQYKTKDYGKDYSNSFFSC